MSDVGLDTVVADEYERKLSLLRFRSDFESRSPVSKSTVQRYLDLKRCFDSGFRAEAKQLILLRFRVVVDRRQ